MYMVPPSGYPTPEKFGRQAASGRTEVWKLVYRTLGNALARVTLVSHTCAYGVCMLTIG
jgi:hypothetical protein